MQEKKAIEDEEKKRKIEENGGVIEEQPIKVPKEWEEAFMYYMKDESRIVEDGEKLNKWAKNNFDIKQTNYKRIKSINKLFV